MDACPTYVEVLNPYESKVDPGLYRTSVKLYEERMFEESFRTFMNYVNKEMAAKCEIERNHWRLPHGSLVVDVSITPDGLFDVNAPFVKLPSQRLAPILRQVCDINTNVLTLSQIKLEGEGLFFHYSCPLALAEPYKTYGVINEICINGDSYDDEFIDEFGAVPLREKQVTLLPPEQVDKAWQRFHSILDEALSYDEYFSAKRWYGFCFDILGMALMKIDYALAPQGYLRTRLEKSISQLWSHRPMEEVVVSLRKDVQEFRAMEKEKFAKDFYRTTFFMHAKRSAEIEGCQKAMAGRYDWAGQDKGRRSSMGMVMNYLYASYDVFYKFFVPAKLQEEIINTLNSCTKKSWEAAAEITWASFQKIMDPAYA
ncbi:MAG: hypothetical protein JRJ87_12115 [Deltaproteobacteria bacterium]|nr:hypothetical protein [Deltaproteobacteria bacterium]